MKIKSLSARFMTGCILLSILVSIFCMSRSLDFELDLIFHHISGLTVVLAKFSQFWGLLYLARFSFVLSSDNIVFTILSTAVASRVLTGSLTTPSWVINLGKLGEDIVVFVCRFLRRFFTVDKFVNGLIYASWLVVERIVTKTVVLVKINSFPFLESTVSTRLIENAVQSTPYC